MDDRKFISSKKKKRRQVSYVKVWFFVDRFGLVRYEFVPTGQTSESECFINRYWKAEKAGISKSRFSRPLPFGRFPYAHFRRLKMHHRYTRA